MEFTATGNDVLTGCLSDANDKWVGLGESLKSFNELGEIGGILGLDGNTHDGGDGVSHDTNGMSIFTGSNGTLLQDVLVNTDESDGVTARNVGNGLDLTAHHNDGSLDGGNSQVALGSWGVVGAQDSDLLAGLDDTREDTTEGVETTLVVSWDELRDEDHKGTLLITVLNGLTTDIINGTLVKVTSSVFLGLDGGRKLHDDHLEKSIS